MFGVDLPSIAFLIILNPDIFHEETPVFTVCSFAFKAF